MPYLNHLSKLFLGVYLMSALSINAQNIQGRILDRTNNIIQQFI